MSVVTQIDTGGSRSLHHATLLFITSVGITPRSDAFGRGRSHDGAQAATASISPGLTFEHRAHGGGEQRERVASGACVHAYDVCVLLRE
jgi:hypothetical protein